MFFIKKIYYNLTVYVTLYYTLANIDPYIILIGCIQPGAMPIAVMSDSSHSLTDTVCLTLLPQCYHVREEKQHLRDLI